jgi:hypothetical protein
MFLNDAVCRRGNIASHLTDGMAMALALHLPQHINERMDFTMNRIIPVHILAGAFISFFAASASFAGDADTAVGGGVGAAAGAMIGQSVGGKTGAIVGGAVGGATGAAVSTSGSGQSGAVVGGAVGGAAGAAVGQAAGGKTGAVIGAGVGGASGAVIGKNVTETPKAQPASTGDMRREGHVLRAGYDNDDHRKKKKKSRKKERCDEEHPGRGHAYGKYKDCD